MRLKIGNHFFNSSALYFLMRKSNKSLINQKKRKKSRQNQQKMKKVEGVNR